MCFNSHCFYSDFKMIGVYFKSDLFLKLNPYLSKIRAMNWEM